MEIPGYKIEDELGRGGMATVYRAMQTSVERRVALKIMSPVLLVDPSFAERFLREARIAANLYHPHIVAVHDVGVHEDQPYIAMEYLSGGDLAARIGAGRVDVPFTVRVVREIAAALDYAHQKGFVHRDVKPENILFREDGAAVLTDFGIARAVNSSTQMTRTGAVIGTPQYMSPEQARGRDLDGRSDLYGLGIVLYELLTGNVPFRGSDSVSVGIMHVTEPVPKLPKQFDHVQPILDRFLAKHADDRFQSGAQAARDLELLEAQLITGQTPRVNVPTPKPSVPTPPAARDRVVSLDETTALPIPGQSGEKPVALDETTALPTPPSRRPTAVGVSATPRPDGSLRREPTLGSLEDLTSFDRTVSQPAFKPPKTQQEKAVRPARPERRRRRIWPLFLVLVLASAGGVGWWQREALLDLLPDPEVAGLLERARAAYEYRYYYGETQEYANRLYARVLELDPGNAQAVAGLELIAGTFLQSFDSELAAGDYEAAQLSLERAEELAPGLAAVVAARGRFERVAVVDADSSPSTSLTDAPSDGPRVDAGSEPDSTAAADTVSDSAPAVDAVAIARSDAEALVEEGQQRLAEGRLIGEDGALVSFRAALERWPDAPEALAGLQTIEASLREQFQEALAADRFEDASATLVDLETAFGVASAAALRAELSAERERADQLARAAAALETLLLDAERALASGRLTRPAGESAVALFQRAAELAPDDPRPSAGITRVAQRLLALAEISLEEDELDRAEAQIELIAELSPNLFGLQRARNRLELYRAQGAVRTLTEADQARLDDLLSEAEEALARGDLMGPPGSSAYDALKAALNIDPQSPAVQAGLEKLGGTLLALARKALVERDLATASSRLAEVEQTNPFQAGLPAFQNALAADFRAATREAIDAGVLDEAQAFLLKAIQLDPDHEDVPELELALSIARDAAG